MATREDGDSSDLPVALPADLPAAAQHAHEQRAQEDTKATGRPKGGGGLAFVMTRCMQKARHCLLWREAHACIRQFYPDVLVIVIDDHSDPDLALIEKDRDDEYRKRYNTRIVHSRLAPGIGELLPYMYGCVYNAQHAHAHAQPIDTFVLMHDSMFLQRRLPEPCATELARGFRFLWHFHSIQQHDEVHRQEGLLRALRLPTTVESELVALRNDATRWTGCFGAAMRISHALLKRLETEYNLLHLAHGTSPAVRTRPDRCAFERVIAVLCYHAAGCPPLQLGLVGDILARQDAFKRTHEQYRELKAKRAAAVAGAAGLTAAPAAPGSNRTCAQKQRDPDDDDDDDDGDVLAVKVWSAR